MVNLQEPTPESPDHFITAAEHALDFAFNPTPEVDIDSIAVADSLSQTISELQELPDYSSIAWSQGYWKQKPVQKVTGISQNIFSDGSEVHLTISQPTEHAADEDSPFRDDQLFVRISTRYAENPSQMVSVNYRIPKEGGKVLCETDSSMGMSLQAALDTMNKAEEAEYMDDGDLEDALFGVLAESSIMQEGLDPDLDPDIEQKRNDSESYRIISDSVRDAAAGKELADQMGIDQERLVGIEEINKLNTLLRSF